MASSKSAVDLLSGIVFSDVPPSSANSSFHTPNGKFVDQAIIQQGIAEAAIADDLASVSLPTRSRSNSNSSSSDDTASVVHDAVDDVYGRLSAELLDGSFDDNKLAMPRQNLNQQTPASGVDQNNNNNKTALSTPSSLSTSIKSVGTVTAGGQSPLPQNEAVVNNRNSPVGGGGNVILVADASDKNNNNITTGSSSSSTTSKNSPPTHPITGKTITGGGSETIMSSPTSTNNNNRDENNMSLMSASSPTNLIKSTGSSPPCKNQQTSHGLLRLFQPHNQKATTALFQGEDLTGINVLLTELRSLRADNERLNRQVSDLARNKTDSQSAVNNLAMAIISNIAQNQNGGSKSNLMGVDAESQSSCDTDQPSPIIAANAVQLSAPRHLMSLPVASQRSFTQLPGGGGGSSNPDLSQIPPKINCSACVETKKVLNEVVHAVNTVRLELEELKLSQKRMLDCLKTTSFLSLSAPNPYPAIENGEKVVGKPPFSSNFFDSKANNGGYSTGISTSNSRYVASKSGVDGGGGNSNSPPPVKASEIPVRVESPPSSVAKMPSSTSYLSGLSSSSAPSMRLSGSSYLNGIGSVPNVSSGSGGKKETSASPPSTAASSYSSSRNVASKSSPYISGSTSSVSPKTQQARTESVLSSSPLKSSTPNNNTAKASSYLPETSSANSSWRINVSGSANTLPRSSYNAAESQSTGGSPSMRKVTFQDTRQSSNTEARNVDSGMLETRPISPPASFSSSSTNHVITNTGPSSNYGYNGGTYSPQAPSSPLPKKTTNYSNIISNEVKTERQAVDEIILKYLGNRNASTASLIPTAVNSGIPVSNGVGNSSENYHHLRRSPSPTLKSSREPQTASPSAVHRKLFAPSSSLDGIISQLKTTTVEY